MMSKVDFTSATDAQHDRAEQNPEDMTHPDVLAAQKAAEERRMTLDTAAPYVGSFFRDAVTLMQRRAEGKALPVPVPWPNVREALRGGLWPGLHVLTGGTGDGKSQWALQVALCAARAGVPVLYVGLELGREDLTARLMSLILAERRVRAPVWSDIYFGKVDNIPALAAECETDLKGLPLRLEVGPPHGWSADLLSARAKALREEHPETNGPGSLPMLVVLDYLQVIAPPEGSPNQELRERIGRAAYAGRAVARDLGAAVLMLSSISRENVLKIDGWRKGKDGELGNSDKVHPSELVGMGKESGDIEFAADVVMTLCRGERKEHDRGERKEHESVMHLAVAKVRGGVPSWCKLSFNGGWFSPSREERTF